MSGSGVSVLEARPESRRLLGAISITAAILIAELIGGIASNSLALLSDAGHMFTDLVALAFSYFGIWAACRPASGRASFGYHRVEILCALGNGSILFLLALGIVVEAVQRMGDPPAVRAGIMTGVAAIGLAANVISVALLTGYGCNLNLRAARWHVLGDALSSLGVILGGTVIWITGWRLVDPALSCGIAVVIVFGAVRLLKESVDVLLEATPTGIRLPEVSGAIESIPGIAAVHDLHVWSITTGMTALSGHVVVETPFLDRTDDLLNRIKGMLKREFRIEHTTIQVESKQYDEIGQVH
ncbi:MAG: cation transporter [Acidobacteria bacterium]|nr:cation transporter [Acidobacteriota bacterium]